MIRSACRRLYKSNKDNLSEYESVSNPGIRFAYRLWTDSSLSIKPICVGDQILEAYSRTGLIQTLNDRIKVTESLVWKHLNRRPARCLARPMILPMCLLYFKLQSTVKGHFQARPHDVPLFAWTGTTVPRRSRYSSHRSCIATSATFRQPTPAHCASLSTQHIRSSGFSGCWSDGLELTAGWTQRSGVWYRQLQTVL